MYVVAGENLLIGLRIAVSLLVQEPTCVQSLGQIVADVAGLLPLHVGQVGVVLDHSAHVTFGGDIGLRFDGAEGLVLDLFLAGVQRSVLVILRQVQNLNPVVVDCVRNLEARAGQLLVDAGLVEAQFLEGGGLGGGDLLAGCVIMHLEGERRVLRQVASSRATS